MAGHDDDIVSVLHDEERRSLTPWLIRIFRLKRFVSTEHHVTCVPCFCVRAWGMCVCACVR